MARMRRGKSLNGWLAIDKPPGLTSTAVVGRVKRYTGAAKVGHGGTLDPLATGVLPVALGQATKTIQYVMDGLKRYRFVTRWGEERDTDDAEGKVIAVSEERPSGGAITAVLPAFTGMIEQVPPRFSAIKLEGRRAYDIARSEGAELALQPRQVHIASFTLVAQLDADHVLFEVCSGKGAYMRALARDLARALGTVGHISELRRTACGPFHSGETISLDKLEEIGHNKPASEYLLPVATALADIPALVVSTQEAYHLGNGQPIPVLRVLSRNARVSLAAGDTIRAMAEGRVVALARIEGGELRPVRVLGF
ncbi:MAG: tRNA pseudouridine55 synthase [Rhodospirillaceae bacterium]|nr:MAG: tRNA pseudouridine55 synthase [Rhodospirillaceae bacterium]